MNIISKKLKELIDEYTYLQNHSLLEDLQDLINEIENYGEKCECGGVMIFNEYDQDRKEFICFKCGKSNLYNVGN